MQNSVKIGVLNHISTILGYVQGALRKKGLIASFVEHFRKSHENTISVFFQCYTPKLIRRGV